MGANKRMQLITPTGEAPWSDYRSPTAQRLSRGSCSNEDTENVTTRNLNAQAITGLSPHCRAKRFGVWPAGKEAVHEQKKSDNAEEEKQRHCREVRERGGLGEEISDIFLTSARR